MMGYIRLSSNIRLLLPRYQPLCFQYYSPPILLSHPSNVFPVTITSGPHLAASLLHPHFPEPPQAQYCKVITLVTVFTQGSFSYGTSPLPSSSSSPSPGPRNGHSRCPSSSPSSLAGVWEEKAGKTFPLEWACLIWCLFSVPSAHSCLMDFIYDVQRKEKKRKKNLCLTTAPSFKGKYLPCLPLDARFCLWDSAIKRHKCGHLMHALKCCSFSPSRK